MCKSMIRTITVFAALACLVQSSMAQEIYVSEGNAVAVDVVNPDSGAKDIDSPLPDRTDIMPSLPDGETDPDTEFPFPYDPNEFIGIDLVDAEVPLPEEPDFIPSPTDGETDTEFSIPLRSGCVHWDRC